MVHMAATVANVDLDVDLDGDGDGDVNLVELL
jgi:hypothetical protein